MNNEDEERRLKQTGRLSVSSYLDLEDLKRGPKVGLETDTIRYSCITYLLQETKDVQTDAIII